MKRTYNGYETEHYKIVRYISTNIFTCAKTVEGFRLIEKATGKEVSYSPWLKDIRKELKEMGEEI